MEELAPMTEKDLANSIAIAFAALRARGDIGKRVSDGFCADKLAASLWRGNLRPFKIAESSSLWDSAHTKFAGDH